MSGSEQRPNGELSPDDPMMRAGQATARPPMTGDELAQLAETRPPLNIMLHGYRQLSEDQDKQLRELKDSALQLWNDLHLIDGSSVEQREFDHFELRQAGIRLEEMMLWIEKFYNV